MIDRIEQLGNDGYRVVAALKSTLENAMSRANIRILGLLSMLLIVCGCFATGADIISRLQFGSPIDIGYITSGSALLANGFIGALVSASLSRLEKQLERLEDQS